MKAAFYAGRSGLIAQQEAMDIIGNNLANVNTNGYQSQGVSFQSLLSNQMYVNNQDKPLSGNGVKATATGQKQGINTLRNTGNMLDFAITGEGYFGVQVGEGEDNIQYTRDGAFTIALDGDTAYLATLDGNYVLNADGDTIEMPLLKDAEKPEGSTSDTKKDENDMSYDYNAVRDSIGIYVFPHPSALNPLSSNRYMATEQAGEVTALEEGQSAGRMLQGVLEISNTSVTDEMANMIAAQRAFQISARVVQTADENERTINDLRK